jgi:hypothetical protein
MTSGRGSVAERAALEKGAGARPCETNWSCAAEKQGRQEVDGGQVNEANIISS